MQGVENESWRCFCTLHWVGKAFWPVGATGRDTEISPLTWNIVCFSCCKFTIEEQGCIKTNKVEYMLVLSWTFLQVESWWKCVMTKNNNLFIHVIFTWDYLFTCSIKYLKSYRLSQHSFLIRSKIEPLKLSFQLFELLWTDHKWIDFLTLKITTCLFMLFLTQDFVYSLVL